MKKEYKQILINYLDEREFKDEKIKLWVNNILNEAKNYFTRKYMDYDLYLFCLVSEKGVFFRQNTMYAGIQDTDKSSFVDFETNSLYVVLNFFFFEHYNLLYKIEENESEIIRFGQEILNKYLEDKKFEKNKIMEYNSIINNEHANFILKKENNLRYFILNRIFKNPVKRYYYKYLVHGKEIYSKIFQGYSNDSLTCGHEVFFFK